MLSGYLAGYLRLLPEGGSEVLSRFVFLIAMPAFIFVSLATIPLDAFFDWPYLATLGGGMLVIFGISLLVAIYVFPGDLAAHSLHALTAMFSSTAYIGLPVILIVFGQDGLVPGIIGAVITVAIFMPLAIVLIEIDRGHSRRRIFTASMLALLRNPLLLSTVAGLGVSAVGIAVPVALASFCKLLGNAFIPCALFSAGLFISGCSIKGEVREISWLVTVKLLLHPLVTWWLAYHVFRLEGIFPAIAVLQAALPSGVPVFVLAQHYQSFITRSSAVIAVSTILSLLSLPVLLFMLG